MAELSSSHLLLLFCVHMRFLLTSLFASSMSCANWLNLHLSTCRSSSSELLCLSPRMARSMALVNSTRAALARDSSSLLLAGGTAGGAEGRGYDMQQRGSATAAEQAVERGERQQRRTAQRMDREDFSLDCRHRCVSSRAMLPESPWRLAVCSCRPRGVSRDVSSVSPLAKCAAI